MFTVADEDMIMQMSVKSNIAQINTDQKRKSSKTFDFIKKSYVGGQQGYKLSSQRQQKQKTVSYFVLLVFHLQLSHFCLCFFPISHPGSCPTCQSAFLAVSRG